MKEFKPLKELVKALTYIGDAIEGKNSNNESENLIEIDNTFYIIDGDYRNYVNKNFDDSKLTDNFINIVEKIQGNNITKLGDILNQDGVDLLNEFLKEDLNNATNYTLLVFVKINSANGSFNALTRLFIVRKDDTAFYVYSALQGASPQNNCFYTEDKYNLDTPFRQISVD